MSKELRAHAASTVSARLNVPEWALFARWYTDRRVFWFESSSGSRLAVVDADAGTIRYSARSKAVGAAEPLNYAGPVRWYPHSRLAVALAEARRAAAAEPTPEPSAEPEPEPDDTMPCGCASGSCYCDGPPSFDLDNGATRMSREVREAFEPPADELHYTRGIGSGATHRRVAFECDKCGATFEDGIDAGHHEADHTEAERGPARAELLRAGLTERQADNVIGAVACYGRPPAAETSR